MTADEVYQCHSRGCTVETPQKMFMCAWHWTRLPASLRLAVWDAYRTGQALHKQPSVAYMAAARAAIAWIAANEVPGARWDE